jgi:hypothetical protein
MHVGGLMQQLSGMDASFLYFVRDTAFLEP